MLIRLSLLLLIGTAVWSRPARADEQPFALSHGQIYLAGKIDNGIPVLLRLSPNARTVIDRRSVALFGAEAFTSLRLDELALADWREADLGAQQKAARLPFDGIVGRALTHGRIIRLDFARHRIAWWPAAEFRPPDGVKPINLPRRWDHLRNSVVIVDFDHGRAWQ